MSARLNLRTGLLRCLSAATVALLLGACTQVRSTYPDRSADEVWTAMRAVAEEPRYDDWIVIENAVHSDEAARQIEIYRELRRDLALPATRIQREERTYRFRVTLEDGPPADVTFTSRGWAVPAHAHTEGTRFLEEIRTILAGMPLPGPMIPLETAEPAPVVGAPSPPPPPPSAQPAPQPSPAPQPPPVDIDAD